MVMGMGDWRLEIGDIWRPDCGGGKQPPDVVSQKPNSRSESTMKTPPPSARSHNNNLNKERHCHCSKTKYFLLSRLLLLIVLATSTPTSSLEFQCASFLPAFNDSFHFNPSAILDKIKPESTSAMRAWTCHGRTHKEMVEKLKSVSRRTK